MTEDLHLSVYLEKLKIKNVERVKYIRKGQ